MTSLERLGRKVVGALNKVYDHAQRPPVLQHVSLAAGGSTSPNNKKSGLPLAASALQQSSQFLTTASNQFSELSAVVGQAIAHCESSASSDERLQDLLSRSSFRGVSACSAALLKVLSSVFTLLLQEARSRRQPADKQQQSKPVVLQCVAEDALRQCLAALFKEGLKSPRCPLFFKLVLCSESFVVACLSLALEPSVDPHLRLHCCELLIRASSAFWNVVPPKTYADSPLQAAVLSACSSLESCDNYPVKELLLYYLLSCHKLLRQKGVPEASRFATALRAALPPPLRSCADNFYHHGSSEDSYDFYDEARQGFKDCQDARPAGESDVVSADAKHKTVMFGVEDVFFLLPKSGGSYEQFGKVIWLELNGTSISFVCSPPTTDTPPQLVQILFSELVEATVVDTDSRVQLDVALSPLPVNSSNKSPAEIALSALGVEREDVETAKSASDNQGRRSTRTHSLELDLEKEDYGPFVKALGERWCGGAVARKRAPPGGGGGARRARARARRRRSSSRTPSKSGRGTFTSVLLLSLSGAPRRRQKQGRRAARRATTRAAW